MNIYTDIALEIAQSLGDTEGIKMDTREMPEAQLSISRVVVENNEAAQRLGKPQGTYITLESPLLRENLADVHEIIIKELAANISAIHDIDKDSSILVIGLGNWNITPDALGPKVVSKLLVTRHLVDTTAIDPLIEHAVRPVAAISPGVMGITGIETGEIVLGLVERIRPGLVIAVDALAARSIRRINSSIQISDTGINPGAGMGNKRMRISHETLGIPVLALGVPTVVDAATLINDSLDSIIDTLSSDDSTDFYKSLQGLKNEDKYDMIKNSLAPYSGNMFVTPKEVDAVVERLSRIISNAINIALHPGISAEDINKYF